MTDEFEPSKPKKKSDQLYRLYFYSEEFKREFKSIFFPLI